MNRPVRRPAGPPARPLGDDDIAHLQALLDALPPPCEPLDAAMLDGYLCGVLLQPRRVAADDWLPAVLGASDGGPSPTAPTALIDLLRRRHAELDAAIERRDWFDPWVFELEAAATADETAAPIDAVQPWVAGFALAMERFPDLMALDAKASLEPLALLFRHLAADDLEDAGELIALIETLEPPARLDDAVEELVRATLLLADVSRPRRPAGAGRGGRR